MVARRYATPIRERDNPEYEPPIPPSRSCLVDKATTTQTFTRVRETDTLTAVKRGLAEYIGVLSFVVPSGRQVTLQRSLYDWADHEEKAVYPSAIVYSTSDGNYDASRFTPGVSNGCKTEDGAYLIELAEYTVPLLLEVHANDPEERIALAMMLEDALNPVTWMYGFKLVLPHYHGLFAKYELLTKKFPDDRQSVISRNRLIQKQLQATVAYVRCDDSIPTLNEVRTTVVVTDGNEPC